MGKSIKLKNDIYWDIDSIRANGKPIDYIVESNIFRNLLNVGNAKTSANTEININKTNNQISINGSPSIVTNIFLDSPKANKDEEGIILKAGTYTATIKKVSGSLSGGDIEFSLRKSDGDSIYNGTRVWTQKILSGVQDDAVYSNTFTLEEETRLHWIGYCSGEPRRTFNNLVLQFQIEESPTPTSYTPWAGYIVESGSNDYGKWIKYSDGTMICTRSIEKQIPCNKSWGSLFYGFDSDAYNFAQEFITPPLLYLFAYQRLSSSFWLSNYYNTIITTTGWRNYAIMRPTSAENVAYTLNVLAIGRWK